MGSAAEKAIENDESLSLLGGARRGDDLAEAITRLKPDVVLDLTVAEVAEENASIILSSGTPAVLGTSGFTEESVARLRKIAEEKSVGGIIAPNFAIGAVLMMMFAEKAAAYLPDVEIVEMHHDQKQDAPSGTAQRTAEMIAAARTSAGINYKPNVAFDKRAIDVAGVGVHSIRLPGLVAHQQLVFGGSGEMLSIRHDSLNRECFMPGVCLACRVAPSLKTLQYGLETIL